MGAIAFSSLWLVVCVWASFVVADRVKEHRHRTAYYLLIWLVPCIGAAAAILLTRNYEPTTNPTASDKMFEAIVDSHRQKDSG